eukprot:Lithocolla_globosa_v1_NODE_4375_length_1451_cov_13.474212.p2 type:complete len:109 gc:universal NODE_4375_length_1451_cov_13.474212:334-660(+)
MCLANSFVRLVSTLCNEAAILLKLSSIASVSEIFFSKILIIRVKAETICFCNAFTKSSKSIAPVSSKKKDLTTSFAMLSSIMFATAGVSTAATRFFRAFICSLTDSGI